MCSSQLINWDPYVLHLYIDNDGFWFDSINGDNEYPISQLYDDYGNYHHCVEVDSSTTTPIEDDVDMCVMYHTNK